MSSQPLLQGLLVFLAPHLLNELSVSVKFSSTSFSLSPNLRKSCIQQDVLGSQVLGLLMVDKLSWLPARLRLSGH